VSPVNPNLRREHDYDTCPFFCFTRNHVAAGTDLDFLTEQDGRIFLVDEKESESLSISAGQYRAYVHLARICGEEGEMWLAFKTSSGFVGYRIPSDVPRKGKWPTWPHKYQRYYTFKGVEADFHLSEEEYGTWLKELVE